MKKENKTYKIKGELAGYAAIAILIIMFVVSVYSIAVDFHVKGDIFLTLLLIGLFEGCRELYLDYRKIEEANVVLENKKKKN